MAREWRLNPPPNWPLPADPAIGLDWRPDPAWGPPPVGWELWQRRRVRSGRTVSLLTVGLLSAAVALVGTLVGEPASAGPAVSTEPAACLAAGHVVSAVSVPVVPWSTCP